MLAALLMYRKLRPLRKPWGKAGGVVRGHLGWQSSVLCSFLNAETSVFYSSPGKTSCKVVQRVTEHRFPLCSACEIQLGVKDLLGWSLRGLYLKREKIYKALISLNAEWSGLVRPGRKVCLPKTSPKSSLQYVLCKWARGLTKGEKSSSLFLKNDQTHTWASNGTREYKIRRNSHMDNSCWKSYLGHSHLMHIQHGLSTIGVLMPIWQNGSVSE